MNPVEFDKNENYFENLQTITNFFKRYKSVGFLFAVANFRQVVNDINLNIINESSAVGKTINIIELEWNGQKGIITQLEFFLKENPSNGLIINNIDELIEESKGEIIYSLNYAREGLIALNIPILFWLNDENHARFSLEAIDLYLRRDFSTVFFEDIDLSQKHLLLNTVFSDNYQTTEDYQNTRIRIELLEKQLHEAEEKGYPPQKIAREIVVDLISEYQFVSLFNEAYKLVIKYETNFDWENSLILNNIAAVYQSLGHVNKARILLDKALEIDTEKLGEKNIDVINRQSNLGGLYLDLGEYDKARELLEKAFKNGKILLGNNDYRLSSIKSNLSELYFRLKEYNKALNLSLEELKITIANFGENHTNTAMSYRNVAKSYQSTGNYKKAKGLLEKALKIIKQNHGDKHPKFGSILGQLGILYLHTGEWAMAKIVIENSIKLETEIFGDKHLKLGFRFYNLSFALEKLGESGPALYYAQKAYKFLFDTYGSKHPEVKNSLKHLQSLQQKSLTQSEA
jgi:tetratricopeptide (TPR) repeat protein